MIFERFPTCFLDRRACLHRYRIVGFALDCTHLLSSGGAVHRHKGADLGFCRTARFTTAANLRDKRRVVYRVASKPAFPDIMYAAERFDIAEQIIHGSHMRRTYPSGQGPYDGFVRKLCRTYPSWDTTTMVDHQFDIERIRTVLREKTTGPGAPFSQRGLSKEANEGRDTVGDIINGRNKNPTSKVLANLARALGGDLSMFGLSAVRSEPPTEAELEFALREMLPGMPKGALDKRARYLAESVGRALRLRPGRLPIDQPNRLSEHEEGVPLP